MAYSLSNKCAKNLCKRTVLVQVIIKKVVTCFLEHSVECTSRNFACQLAIAANSTFKYTP